jgi:hypothetical protein
MSGSAGPTSEFSSLTLWTIWRWAGNSSAGFSTIRLAKAKVVADLVDGFLHDVLGSVGQGDHGVGCLFDALDQVRIDGKSFSTVKARQKDHRSTSAPGMDVGVVGPCPMVRRDKFSILMAWARLTSRE